MDPLEPINSSPDSSPREESFDLFNQGIDSDLAATLGPSQRAPGHPIPGLGSGSQTSRCYRRF